MNAFIFAAGLGSRMGRLTQDTPKPLLTVGARPLIEWHLQKLEAAGYSRVFVNTHWLAHKLSDYLQSLTLDLDIIVCHEPELLETGGGLRKMAQQLGDAPLPVISADVWSDFDYQQLAHTPLSSDLARLVLVDNPAHHPKGDFGLTNTGRVVEPSVGEAKTFSGICVLSPEWIRQWPSQPKIFPMALRLREAICANRVSGQCHSGCWVDVGTPQRLSEANQLALS